jgi:uncharacterized membrane protein
VLRTYHLAAMKTAEAFARDVDVGAVHGAPGQRVWLLARASLIAAVTAGCTVAVVTGWASPVRAALAVIFLLFCPGLALAEVLEIHDLGQRIAIATGASLALDTLLSLSLIYAGAFSLTLAIAILAGMTLVALCAGLVRALSRSRRPRRPNPADSLG